MSEQSITYSVICDPQNPETILLKAIAANKERREEILDVIFKGEISEEFKEVYIAVLLCLEETDDLTVDILKTKLNDDISEEIFKLIPSDVEINMAMDILKKKWAEKKKILGKIAIWKKSIDAITLKVEQGSLQPQEWLTKILKILPSAQTEDFEKKLKEALKIKDSKITEVETEAKRLKTELEKEQKTKDDAIKEKELLNLKISALERDLNFKKDKDEEKNALIKTLQQTVKKLSLNKENEKGLEAKLENLTQETKEKERIIAELKEKTTQFEEIEKEQLEEIENLDKALLRAEHALNIQTEQIKIQNSQNEELAKQLEAMTKVQIENDSNGDKLKQLEIIEKEVALKNEEINQKNEQILQLQKTIQTIENELTNKSEEELQTLKRQIKSLETELASKNASINSKQDQIERLKKENKILKENYLTNGASASIGDDTSNQKHIFLEDVWSNVLNNINEHIPSIFLPLETGFAPINSKIGGLSGLTAICGQPKTGKTSLALQLSFETLVRNEGSFSIFYTTDHIPEYLYCRLISQLSGVKLKNIMLGNIENLSEDETKFLQKTCSLINLYKDKLAIISMENMPKSIGDLKLQIGSITAKNDCDKGLIVIDSILPFINNMSQSSGLSPAELLNELRILINQYSLTLITTARSKTDESELITDVMYASDHILEICYEAAEDNLNTDLKTDSKDIMVYVASRDAKSFPMDLTFNLETCGFAEQNKKFKARKISNSSNIGNKIIKKEAKVYASPKPSLS